MLALTKRLIAVRRTYPDFTDPRFEQGRALSDDEAGWLVLERGDMIMVINFHDRATEVDVGRTVNPVITLGQVEVTGDVVRLGPHSAIAATAAQHKI